MANPKSHHLDDLEAHVLVLIDGQPREASYTTVYDDGTRGATVHVLYYQKNPKDAADPLAQTGGEVRSMPLEEWKKPMQPIALPPEVEPITFDSLIGADASALPEEAAELLRAFGGVDAEGKVLPVKAWART